MDYPDDQSPLQRPSSDGDKPETAPVNGGAREPVDASRATPALNGRVFRDAMSLFPSGVTVAAADDGHSAHGLTVASFASVSLDPPLCLICVKKSSAFLPIVSRSRAFSVSFLAADGAETALLFATAEAPARLGALIRRPGAPPLAPGALARIDLTLETDVDAGDHRVLIGRVTAIDAPAKADAPAPLTWWRGKIGALGPI